MFAQAFAVTLRILGFRAGPQDFPFDPRPNLVLGCIAFALLSNTAILSLMLPIGGALMGSAANVAVLALFTRVTLTLLKLDNRFQQTFNALLATGGALTLMMVPFFAQVAPAWLELSELLRANPELADRPEQWPAIPMSAMNVLMILGIWQLVVMCRIFMLAAGTGAMLALIALLLVTVSLQLGVA